jgi:ribosome maturation factor RimP
MNGRKARFYFLRKNFFGAPMTGGVTENIRAMIQAKLAELGLELFDIRYFQAGSRSILRVIIDSRAGVTIGDCEKVSNVLSILLDVEDYSAGRKYTLEVSSPGIDRPLKTERDFRRAVERFVTLQMNASFSGKKTLRGKVLQCENNIVRCDVEGVLMDLPLTVITSGKEEIRFK